MGPLRKFIALHWPPTPFKSAGILQSLIYAMDSSKATRSSTFQGQTVGLQIMFWRQKPHVFLQSPLFWIILKSLPITAFKFWLSLKAAMENIQDPFHALPSLMVSTREPPFRQLNHHWERNLNIGLCFQSPAPFCFSIFSAAAPRDPSYRARQKLVKTMNVKNRRFFAVPGAPKAIKAVVKSPRSVVVSWLPPQPANGIVDRYHIYLR